MARPVDAKERRAQHEAREHAERYGTVVPERRAPVAPAPDAPAPAIARVRHGVVSWLKTAAKVFGTFYILGFVAVMWFTVSRVSSRWRPTGVSQQEAASYARTVPALPYRLPFDPAIAPEAAGAALNRIQPINPQSESGVTSGVTMRPPESRPAIPWSIPIPRDLFPATLSPSAQTGLPRSVEVLAFARGRPSPTQREAMRLIGTAAVWKEFDLVARAKAIDVVGTRYVLPFDKSATALFVPVPFFPNSREFVHASYTRAAWHLSEGRLDSAEFALRALISHGMALMENGATAVEWASGRRLANGGIDGLVRLYGLNNDPRGKALAEASKAAEAAALADPTYAPPPRGDVPAAERRLIAMMNGPLTPRAARPELVRTLQRGACGSVAGIFRGPSPEVRAAIDAVSRDFVRYPGDAEWLAVIDREMSTHTQLSERAWGGLAAPVNLISRIYFMPRLGTCSIVAIGGFGFR